MTNRRSHLTQPTSEDVTKDMDAAVPSGSVPTYEPDDGPLSDEQLAQIRKMVPQGRFKAKVGRSLFDLNR